MQSANYSISAISKFSDALLSLFESPEDKQRLLKDLEQISLYFEKEPDILHFLSSHVTSREIKQEILEVIEKSGLDSYLMNSLLILLDKNLIFHVKLFLSTLNTKLNESLSIRSVYIYSSFEIAVSQKKKIEKLWAEKLKEYKCVFFYAIDKSLRLGVKVQVGNYVEEFSVASNLLNVKLKLDSIFV